MYWFESCLEENIWKYSTYEKSEKHPTARIVSQLGGKADDRAEAPPQGASAAPRRGPLSQLPKFVGGHWNPNEICGWTLKS